jgi:hypothetical protein
MPFVHTAGDTIYILQLTVATGSKFEGVFNLQGRSIGHDRGAEDWELKQIRFRDSSSLSGGPPTPVPVPGKCGQTTDRNNRLCSRTTCVNQRATTEDACMQGGAQSCCQWTTRGAGGLPPTPVPVPGKCVQTTDRNNRLCSRTTCVNQRATTEDACMQGGAQSCCQWTTRGG